MNKANCQALFVTVGLLLTCWAGWHEVEAKGAEWLPIRYVRIEGAFQYIAKDKIKHVLSGQMSNGLYNANIQHIQQAVIQLPWAEKVDVKRIWPDAIDIKIIEQKAVVRWGEAKLLNKKGEMFVPENLNKFQLLPLLKGPEGSEKNLLEVMQGLSLALNDQGMRLKEFRVNKRRAWRIKCQNGLELLLGRNEQLDKFQRFLKTISLIGDEQLAKVEIVDLRYPNGYALTWKQGEEQIDWKKIAELSKT